MSPKIIITANTRNARWPREDMTKEERLRYMVSGRITVLQIQQFDHKAKNFHTSYLPRIRGKNIVVSLKLARYQTPDQAYCAGKLAKRNYKKKLEKLQEIQRRNRH